MNKLPATVCAFLLMSSIALAQAPPCISDNPDAVPIDTIRTSLSIASIDDPAVADTTVAVDSSSADTSISYRAKGKSNGQITLDICIWRTETGITYSIPLNSIRFSGEGSAIDSMPTATLFDLLAQAAIGQGLAAGYSTCPRVCGTGFVHVVLPACVRRSGKGLDTKFESCVPDACCDRTYSICCPDGGTTPYIELVGAAGADCPAGDAANGGTCESLCH